MTVLTCKNLKKSYKKFQLQNISFQIESGYLTALVGENGSGKTTLLNCLSGAVRFLGDVSLGDFSLQLTPQDYKQHIGCVSESLSFFMEKNPLDNALELGIFYKNWSLADYYYYLDLFKLNPAQPLYQLSRGNYMKFQTCFALAHQPDFLILDEPTAGFDPVFRIDFMKLIKEILDKDVGVLMSTHITEDLDHTADHVLVLKNGSLINNSSIEQLGDVYRSDGRQFHIRDLL